MNNVKLPLNITDKFSFPAAFRTANIFDFGSTKLEYVPRGLINLFASKSDAEYNASGAPAKLAHIALKTGIGMAATAAAVWGIRALLHSVKVDAIDDVNPAAAAGDKLLRANKRLVAPILAYTEKDKKIKLKMDKKNILKKAFLDPYNTAISTVPLSAALLVALATYSQADKFFDARFGKKLDKDIAKAKQESDDIAKRRIMRARGITTEPAELLKTASLSILPKQWLGSIALVLAALTALSFTGGFNYQRDNSKAVAKYKAYKKGLEGYSKEKLKEEAINSSPIDPRLADLFDSNLAQNKKSAPGIEADPMKEILI